MSDEAPKYMAWVTAAELALLPADMRRKALAYNVLACTANVMTAIGAGGVAASVRWAAASVAWQAEFGGKGGTTPTLPTGGETFTIECGGLVETAQRLSEEARGWSTKG